MARLIARSLLMFVTAVAALYLVGIFGGVALSRMGLPLWPASALAFLVALLLSRFVWTHSEAPPRALGASVLMGAFVVGAIGFVLGFFGPALLSPGANQAPLLGVFVTGPAGFILGAVGGAVYWMRRGSSTSSNA
jgi:hypothetical protein